MPRRCAASYDAQRRRRPTAQIQADKPERRSRSPKFAWAKSLEQVAVRELRARADELDPQGMIIPTACESSGIRESTQATARTRLPVAVEAERPRRCCSLVAGPSIALIGLYQSLGVVPPYTLCLFLEKPSSTCCLAAAGERIDPCLTAGRALQQASPATRLQPDDGRETLPRCPSSACSKAIMRAAAQRGRAARARLIDRGRAARAGVPF